MPSAAVDPIAALLVAGEGRFEWKGRLLGMEPTSGEHGRESYSLTSVIGSYAEQTDAGEVMPDPFAQRLDEHTVRVPDVSFFRKSSFGKLKPTFSEGGADLVIEIVSPDSRLRDRGEKFYEYERAGIEEYWIVDPDRRSAEFYRLHEGVYRPVLPDAEGKVYASTLPGFFIRVEWLWNRAKVLDALRELGVV